MIPKDDLKKMMLGICPICNIPMMKNGKRTHSKTKSLLCETKFREKTNEIHEPQYLFKDGKYYEIDAHYEKK